MRNLLLYLRFCGTNYCGWQIQQNAITVQEVFQNALFQVIGKADIKAVSRLDSKVHALKYAVSVKTKNPIPAERLSLAINRFLPEDIVVLEATEVDLDFHARYSCKEKRYLYKIFTERTREPFLKDLALHYYRKLDENLLNEAASFYVGTHDFTSFCTLDKRDIDSFVRTVSEAEVYKENSFLYFTVKANGFLYNMVRIMVGTLLRVAEGKIKASEIPSIIEAKNRKKAGPTAPAHGLYLADIYY